MASDIDIRLGECRDAEVIARFNVEMARETEGLELDPDVVGAGVRGLFDRPGLGFYVVAEHGGGVVGTLMVTPEWSDWRNGVFWWVQSVYVRPDFRRRGVYRRLYEHVKARAAEHGGVCGVRLYVERDNLVARRTYEALGMSETRYGIYEESLPR